MKAVADFAPANLLDRELLEDAAHELGELEPSKLADIALGYAKDRPSKYDGITRSASISVCQMNRRKQATSKYPWRSALQESVDIKPGSSQYPIVSGL